MAIKRQCPGAPGPWSSAQDEAEAAPTSKHLPYRPLYRHQMWFIDIRYRGRLDSGWVYSICILEGYSRTTLAGMARSMRRPAPRSRRCTLPSLRPATPRVTKRIKSGRMAAVSRSRSWSGCGGVRSSAPRCGASPTTPRRRIAPVARRERECGLLLPLCARLWRKGALLPACVHRDGDRVHSEHSADTTARHIQ